MNARIVSHTLVFFLGLSAVQVHAAVGPLPGWRHTGIIMVLTTPEGANLSVGASVEQFPPLVRIAGEWFDVSRAQPDGADLRVTTDYGAPLPFQIESWDAAGRTASVWVRVPVIQGNYRLPLRLHWGKSDATSVSDGKAVYNESNDYLSIWHLGDTVQFNRIMVGSDGLINIEPHLAIACSSSNDLQDIENCVGCFMPDVKNKDGSIDFIIGWDSKDRGQAKPFVRVIKDFILAKTTR